MEQRSAEWYAARVGRVTASRMSDLMARTKSGYGASRANYLAELVAERLTGQKADRFVSAEMNWGTEQEGPAGNAYMFFRDAEIVPAPFVTHPMIEMSGASPDGYVGEDGLIEIKCPNTATHIDTLLSGSIAGKYAHQMQWQMACTGRAWCDFVSFDPRLPPAMQLFCKRIPRDMAAIAELTVSVKDFLAELDSTVAQLREKYQ